MLLRRLLCVLALSLGAAAAARAQPADAPAPALLAAPDSLKPHSPRTALRRAALLPGWGQYYNRQYYKMPVVYAGLGGLGGLVVYSHREWLSFRRAYLYKWMQDEVDAGRRPENANARYKSHYDALVARYGTEIAAASLRTQRDYYRRNRDLSVVGVGLFYGLTVLDAYVSAHLLDFDVGEDLRLGAAPVGARVGVRGLYRW